MGQPVRLLVQNILGPLPAAVLFRGLFRTSTADKHWLFIGGNGPHGSLIPILSNSKIYKRYQKFAKIGIKVILKQGNIVQKPPAGSHRTR